MQQNLINEEESKTDSNDAEIFKIFEFLNASVIELK